MKTHKLRPSAASGISLSAALLLSHAACAPAQQAAPMGQAAPQAASMGQVLGRLTVQVDKPGIKISPVFYGLMTEEINHSYDGGLYAELIQNRAFKDSARGPAHWSLLPGAGAARMEIDTSQPVPNTALTHALRLDITTPSAGGVGVANDGYWGIPVKPRTRYQASLWAKASEDFNGQLAVRIESNGGVPVASARLPRLSREWKKYSVALTTGDVAAGTANRFVVSAQGAGSVWMTQVSLFPPTFNNRPNGLRPDLMRLMQGLKPTYLRLPGGNYLEGNTIAERFDWKQTIGPIESRPGHQGPWGYRSTDGMGLMEFLLWCEDLKVEPLLAVFAGYALGGEHIVAGPALQPFVQDALDEIEYLIGPATSTWGAKRARDGHPRPFPLRYVEIGNEDWFDKSGSYDGRFAAFHDAIKKRYPQLKTIASAPVRGRVPDLIDDHYYRSARDMARDSGHYDSSDRSGPKIFVGEWASTEGSPTPTLQAALGDAAWLTGLERSSDHVEMQCYAPLLVNVNPGARQWGTNLIGYDALSAYGSPSYWAQAMFGQNTGDTVLPSQVSAAPVARAEAPSGQVGVGTWNTQAEFKDIKVTSPDGRVLLPGGDLKNGDLRTGAGAWSIVDGALRQSSAAENTAAVGGDVAWGDYTLSLKARKISGAEGFLIRFHARDAQNYGWWNIGGWQNTRSAIEISNNGSKSELGVTPTKVETGRWYDIRVELRGDQVRGFIDGKLVTTAVDAPPSMLYSAASRDTRDGTVILKVVNMTPQAQALQVDLQGAREVARTATAQVLEGDPAAVNTIEAPQGTAPRTLTISGVGPSFQHTFPANSVTVMRLKAR